jgi:hypothetical protein
MSRRTVGRWTRALDEMRDVGYAARPTPTREAGAWAVGKDTLLSWHKRQCPLGHCWGQHKSLGRHHNTYRLVRRVCSTLPRQHPHSYSYIRTVGYRMTLPCNNNK